jgi:hypothetical protein
MCSQFADGMGKKVVRKKKKSIEIKTEDLLMLRLQREKKKKKFIPCIGNATKTPTSTILNV